MNIYSAQKDNKVNTKYTKITSPPPQNTQKHQIPRNSAVQQTSTPDL